MASTDLPRTRAALDAGADAGFHVGAQLVAWVDGAPVVDLTQGLARADARMTSGSLMPWFSGTKLVTALAVVQLWDRGVLALDQPVADVVPEFGAAGKHGVTVRHVLTHTGGFRRVGGPPDGSALDGDGAKLNPAALLAAICAAPLEPGWAPGQRAGYHPTTGFHVLGEVVHRVDGRRFEDFVTEEIFEPLGMGDSWLALSPERVGAYGDRLVTMHDTSGPEPRVVARMERPDGWAWVQPSSSGVGPMGDLVRVVEALRQGGILDGERVLSRSATEAMTARHRTSMRDETFGAVIDWGLGVMVNSWHYDKKPAPYGYGDHAGRRAFGHGGRQSSVVFADPERRLSAAIGFNGMPGEAANHRRTQAVITALYEDLGVT